MRETSKIKMPTVNSYCKQILLGRLTYAIVCSGLSQLLFLSVFLFLVNFNALRPMTWMISTVSTLTSFSTWVYLVPLTALTFAQGIMCSREYVFAEPYRGTRFSKFIGIISIKNIIVLTFSVLSGVFIVWLYLSLLSPEYSYVFTVCNNMNNKCLVEKSFFIHLNGIWIGIYYFVKDYLNGPKNLAFPVLQQSKLVRIKYSIYGNLKQAMKDSIIPTLLFIIIYYYQGVSLRDWICNNFGMVLQSYGFHLSDIVPLLAYSWFLSGLFIFSMLSMQLSFEVFLTEHWMFPIESNDKNELILKNALAMDGFPIIQHLACLDFYLLTLWSPQRRQQMFSLSQPGGHPHNWNGIIHEALELVKNFSCDIRKATDAISNETVLLTTPKKSQSPERKQPIYNVNVRNMTLPPGNSIELINVTPNPIFAEAIDNFKTSILSRWKTTLSYIEKKTGIDYFFGDVPESRIYFLLLKGQPVVWAVQGLSYIATAAFSEDRYGIIHKDLPSIITSLITLKQNLDRLSKVNLTHRRSNTQEDNLKMQLQSSLRTAVKRSLYNIANVFGHYVDHLGLTKDMYQQMVSFINYKEG